MTSVYAEVIGDPIAHSKSPLIHNFWLAKLGVEAEYKRVHVRSGEVADYIAGACADANWRGANITIPHKVAVMDFVDDPFDVRATVGAMNTIVRADDGSVWGTNTDAAGFLEPITHKKLRGQRAILIGAGGAAKAVLFALKSIGIGEVTILNRSTEKAAALLASFGLHGRALPLEAPLEDAAVLVNASALGMTGQLPLPLNLAPLGPCAMVYDLVYAPLETSLLAMARVRGLETIDGLHMLVGQAAVAFDLFFGQPAPREHDAELRALLLA